MELPLPWLLWVLEKKIPILFYFGIKDSDSNSYSGSYLDAYERIKLSKASKGLSGTRCDEVQ